MANRFFNSLLGASAAAPPAPIALVQQAVGSAADASAGWDVNVGSPMTAGSVAVCMSGFYVDDRIYVVPVTINDEATAMTSVVMRSGTGKCGASIDYIIATGGETGVHIVGNQASPGAASVSEWSGLGAVGTVQGSADVGTDDTPTITADFFPVSAAENLYLASCVFDNQGGTKTIGAPSAGWTAMTPKIEGDLTTAYAYKINGATTGESCAWTLSGATAWTTVIVGIDRA